MTTAGQPSITPTNGTADTMDGGAVGGIPKRKASPARGKSRSVSPMDMGRDRTQAEEKDQDSDEDPDLMPKRTYAEALKRKADTQQDSAAVATPVKDQNRDMNIGARRSTRSKRSCMTCGAVSAVTWTPIGTGLVCDRCVAQLPGHTGQRRPLTNAELQEAAEAAQLADAMMRRVHASKHPGDKVQPALSRYDNGCESPI